MPFIATCVDAIGTVFLGPSNGYDSPKKRIALTKWLRLFQKEKKKKRDGSFPGANVIFPSLCQSVWHPWHERILITNSKVSEIFTARKQSLRRLCFYRCLSVHRGGVHGCSGGGVCMVAPGGHAWLLGGACMVAPGGMRGCSGGMCGCSGGACMVALGGACMVALGGMRGCSQGGMRGCSQGGMRGIQRDTEIRSMSGRYASYWNAFLLQIISCFL